jgi:hypothetical protein
LATRSTPASDPHQLQELVDETPPGGLPHEAARFVLVAGQEHRLPDCPRDFARRGLEVDVVGLGHELRLSLNGCSVKQLSRRIADNQIMEGIPKLDRHSANAAFAAGLAAAAGNEELAQRFADSMLQSWLFSRPRDAEIIFDAADVHGAAGEW